MAITLDGVALPDLVIEDEFVQTKVRAVANETLGGKPVVWETARSLKTFDLVGGSDFGFIQRSTLLSLRAKADVVAATYTLSYEGTSYNVRFRNEDNGAIEASPIVPRPNHATTDWYNNVRLKLMVI